MSYLDNLLGISRTQASGILQPFVTTLAWSPAVRVVSDAVADIQYVDPKGYNANAAEFCYVAASPSGWVLDATLAITNFNASGWTPDGVAVVPGDTVLLIPHTTEPGLLGLYTVVDKGSGVYNLQHRAIWPVTDPVNPAASFWPYGQNIAIRRGWKYGGRAIHFDDTTPSISAGWLQRIGLAETTGSRILVAPVIFTKTTTNATQQTVATFPIPVTSAAYWCELSVLGRSGTTKYDKRHTFTLWHDGSTLTERGTHLTDSSVDPHLFINRDDSAYSSDFSVSGSNLILTVTGKASTTINWRLALTMHSETVP